MIGTTLHHVYVWLWCLYTESVKSTTESSSLRVTCQWMYELWVSVGAFDTSDNNACFFFLQDLAQ